MPYVFSENYFLSISEQLNFIFAPIFYETNSNMIKFKNDS